MRNTFGRLAGYPKLSHVLNLHLEDKLVPKSKFVALEELVSKQEWKIRSLQTSYDKALSKHIK
jgi:hypothetical protein